MSAPHNLVSKSKVFELYRNNKFWSQKSKPQLFAITFYLFLAKNLFRKGFCFLVLPKQTIYVTIKQGKNYEIVYRHKF